ncbi:MAG: NADH-quinone oxidoreductase subunit NuoK [Polyangiales bacterium]
MTLASCLTLAAALFSLGVFGLLTRRQVVAVLLSVELMANAANLCFVAFSRFRGDGVGEALAVFSLALTVAEVAVGLALVILLYRAHGDTRVDLASEMKQ